jgi:hypothetical protein
VKRSSKTQVDTDQLILWSLEAPAKASPSPAEEKEWLQRAATWPSDLLNWLQHYAPAGFSSRTSPAYSAPLRTLCPIRVEYSLKKDEKGNLVTMRTKEATSDVSLPRFQTSGIVEPTQALTLNISSWRNGGSVCSLSAILEDGKLPQQYYLTSRACKGIQRRAEKRGKTLPVPLAAALESVAGVQTPTE